MPPRLRHPSIPSVNHVDLSTSSPLLPLLLPSSHTSRTSARQFSSTPSTPARFRIEKPFGRRNGFYIWLREHGKRLNNPTVKRNIPSYLSYQNTQPPLLRGPSPEVAAFKAKPRDDEVDWEKAKNEMNRSPFPTNPLFQVHPVISTEFRKQIYQRIKEGRSVRRVSAELNCELDRVAAVVRLQEIEKSWIEEDRPLCTQMQKRVHALMPITEYTDGVIHESITDLPIHHATRNQLFLSTPESAVFGRAQAGEALGILPADVRMPNRELIEVEKMRMKKTPLSEMVRVEREREKKEAETIRLKKEKEEIRKKSEIIVESERWRFRLKSALTGKVGFRYGMPHEDRKRGQTKIPTRVV